MQNNRLSVSQLAAYIEGVFEDELVLHDIRVFGEVEECSYGRGNAYFSINDSAARLSCVYFGASAEQAALLRAGDEVLLLGTVTYFKKGGRVTFKVKAVEPYGKGKKLLELNALKEKLKAEGLFDRRPPLPEYIARAAVITSGTGAVIHDFLRVLLSEQTYPEVSVYPVRVQGAAAAGEIAGALRKILSSKPLPDVIVIARGGGSVSDLSAFNDEALSRAVSASSVPVISAVGHETDYTLCDFCSSLRAGTPSIAATSIVSVNRRAFERVEGLSARLLDALERKIAGARRTVQARLEGLSRASERLTLMRKFDLIGTYTRLKTAEERQRQFIKQAVYTAIGDAAAHLKIKADAAQAVLNGAAVKLDALSPLKLLSSGYVRVEKAGAHIRAAGELKAGDTVDVFFGDGKAVASVTDVKRFKE